MSTWPTIEIETSDPIDRATRPMSAKVASHSCGSRDRSPADDDAARAEPVGEEPERRVAEPRRERVRGHREPDLGVAHRERLANEWHERGEQAVRDVMREVRDGERDEQCATAHLRSETSIPRRTLSMRRVLPTRAASEMTARFAGNFSSTSVSGSATDTYSGATPGSVSTTSSTRARRRSG